MKDFVWSSWFRLLSCLALSTAVALSASAEPLPFRRAMELAAARGAANPAAADQERARAAYQEARSMFLPQMVVGSGLGKTIGFPMTIEGSAPSIFNVSYQSYLFNPAQKEFIRSARAEWNAASAGLEDQRNATLLETAISYVQLDTLASRLKLLHDQEQDASRLENLERERVQAGVDSEMDLTRARLESARVRLRIADAEGAADVLRERLGQLTGLPVASIETVTESIPDIPDLSAEQNLMATVLAASPAVKMAEDQAKAKQLQAKGEHKMMYPAVDAVAQYGVFAKYNNYDLYFNRFQRNNATFGVAIRFPFLNFSGKAHAEAADAEAVKAQRQATNTRNQVSTEALKLGRSVQQLAAAQQVALLEWKLAQGQAEAVKTRIEAQAPAAAPGAAAPAPATPRDLQQARIDANDRYASYLDTTFELEKARMQLLRATGQLQKWALGTP